MVSYCSLGGWLLSAYVKGTEARFDSLELLSDASYVVHLEAYGELACMGSVLLLSHALKSSTS